jgi:hypothetical protein
MSEVPEASIIDLPTESPAYRLTPIGVEFLGELTREDWVALGRKLGDAGKSLGFLIGDWLNYGEGKGDWGDTYTEAMRITGLEYKTLRDYASVSRKVQLSLRNDNLAFELHKKVAPIKDPEEQRKWLGVAQKQAQRGKPMSSRRLAKSILLGRLAKDADMTTPEHKRGRDNIHPHVLRLVQFWRKMKESGWVATADLFLIRNLIEDIQPVMKIHDELCEIARNLEAEAPDTRKTEEGGGFRGP